MAKKESEKYVFERLREILDLDLKQADANNLKQLRNDLLIDYAKGPAVTDNLKIKITQMRSHGFSDGQVADAIDHDINPASRGCY